MAVSAAKDEGRAATACGMNGMPIRSERIGHTERTACPYRSNHFSTRGGV